MSDLEYSLNCQCGNERSLRAEDIPAPWMDGRHILDEVWGRMLCLRCGRRGRPSQIIVNPVACRYSSWRKPQTKPQT